MDNLTADIVESLDEAMKQERRELMKDRAKERVEVDR